MLYTRTQEGDIRGILSNQYMPYYMGAILEILIKADYQKDGRVREGFDVVVKLAVIRRIAPILLFNMRDYFKICTQPPVRPQKRTAFFPYGIRNGHSVFCCASTISEILRSHSVRKLLKRKL